MSQQQAKRSIVSGTILLAIAVLIGAFGAHGLKTMVTPDKLVTFETGVRYHFYHAFGLIILGIFQRTTPSIKANVPYWSFLIGILLFSFNCYFYAISGLKVFAMIVPVGGVLFVLGWLTLSVQVIRSEFLDSI